MNKEMKLNLLSKFVIKDKDQIHYLNLKQI